MKWKIYSLFILSQGELYIYQSALYKFSREGLLSFPQTLPGLLLQDEISLYPHEMWFYGSS